MLKLEKTLNNSNKSVTIRETLIAWSNTCDINCYRKILDYKSNYGAQAIWLFILLASTSTTLFVVSKSLMDYLKYDVVSLTEIVYERSTKFPTLTFCDYNPFSTKEAEKLFEMIRENNSDFLDSYNLTQLASQQASNPSYGDENRKKLGFNLLQIVHCSIDTSDCKENLKWYYSFDYGNCFQYNSIANVTRSGKEFGPSISIFPLINMNRYSTSSANGLALFVHDQEFKPSEPVVYLRPGESTVISVRRKLIKKYPQPYSQCIDLTYFKSDLYDYIMKFNKFYRQKDCLELCIQQMVIEECKCYDLNYPNLRNETKPCLNFVDLICLEDQWEKLNVEECVQISCPLECSSLEYELSSSTLEYPSKSFYMSLIKSHSFEHLFQIYFNQTKPFTPTYEQFKAHAVDFRIYYPSLEYTQITESPKMNTYDLLTQIGGALGLFVSFSVFTLFEIIELFILTLRGFLGKTKRINFS